MNLELLLVLRGDYVVQVQCRYFYVIFVDKIAHKSVWVRVQNSLLGDKIYFGTRSLDLRSHCCTAIMFAEEEQRHSRSRSNIRWPP